MRLFGFFFPSPGYCLEWELDGSGSSTSCIFYSAAVCGPPTGEGGSETLDPSSASDSTSSSVFALPPLSASSGTATDLERRRGEWFGSVRVRLRGVEDVVRAALPADRPVRCLRDVWSASSAVSHACPSSSWMYAKTESIVGIRFLSECAQSLRRCEKKVEFRPRFLVVDAARDTAAAISVHAAKVMRIFLTRPVTLSRFFSPAFGAFCTEESSSIAPLVQRVYVWGRWKPAKKNPRAESRADRRMRRASERGTNFSGVWQYTCSSGGKSLI